MRSRLVLALIVTAGWCLAVILRLVHLQITNHDRFVELAAKQQQRVVELHAPRGTMFDARGRVLAVSVPVDSAWADPAEVDDPAAVAAAVARIVRVDAAQLARNLSADNRFAWVARKLDRPQRQALEAAELPGIHFLEESKRYYPLRELAAPVLGFVGVDDAGLAGLELTYDEVVANAPVRRTLLRDARRGTAAVPEHPYTEARPGRDLVLSLDGVLQHIAEEELQRALDEHHASHGSVVVLDPRTGAVLAMASLPAFDPNRFQDFPSNRWRNTAVQDAYEPGSTFKMLTAAAALSTNRIDPADVIDCQMGQIQLGSTRIRDHKPFGLLSFRQVIAKSSNIGAIKVALGVGAEELHRTIDAFGFGRATGIDLPGEHPGQVLPPDRWRRVRTATISFGQGLSLTALQLASAFAAVANGGVLMRPYVVAAVADGQEGFDERSPEVLGRALPAATAREVERLLEAVVSEEGTGHAAAIYGYRVAGKTGTAQVPEAGGYSAQRFVASFVGFAPARDPALVAAVVVHEPRPPLYHGGQVAAPVFHAIVQRALLYLGVPPGDPLPELTIERPELRLAAEDGERAGDTVPIVGGVG